MKNAYNHEQDQLVLFKLKAPQVQVRFSDPRAKLPERKSAQAAGVDLSVLDDVEVPVGSAVLVPTGLMIAIPDGYAGFVMERSSFNKRFNCSLTNKVGLIDSDYRGEVYLSIRNDSQAPKHILAGERVAQLVVLPVAFVSFVEVDELPATTRGEGGFGSTG